MNFSQKCNVVTDFVGRSDFQNNFIGVVFKLFVLDVQVKVQLWLPLFAENFRCIWRFKRNIFSVDALIANAVAVALRLCCAVCCCSSAMVILLLTIRKDKIIF